MKHKEARKPVIRSTDIENVLKDKIKSFKKLKKYYELTTHAGVLLRNKSRKAALRDLATIYGYRIDEPRKRPLTKTTNKN